MNYQWNMYLPCLLDYFWPHWWFSKQRSQWLIVKLIWLRLSLNLTHIEPAKSCIRLRDVSAISDAKQPICCDSKLIDAKLIRMCLCSRTVKVFKKSRCPISEKMIWNSYSNFSPLSYSFLWSVFTLQNPIHANPKRSILGKESCWRWFICHPASSWWAAAPKRRSGLPA